MDWGDTVYVVAYHADGATPNPNRVGDAFGTNTNNDVRWSMSPTDRNITPASQSTSAFDGAQAVTIGLGAAPGTYTVTFVDGRTLDAGETRFGNKTATFTVAAQPDPIARYTLTGMDSVADGESANYTVAAWAADGSSPSRLRGADASLAGADARYVNNVVSVVVSGSGAENVTLRKGGEVWNLGANDAPRMLELDETETEGAFQMVVPPNTPRGQVTFTVLGEGAAVATVPAVSKTVTIGPPAFASSVMAAQVAGSNAIKVDWSPAEGNTGQIVIVVNRGDTTDYCLAADLGASAKTYTCSEASATYEGTAGATYVALVIALQSDGGFTLGNLPTVMLPAAASSGS